MDDKSSYSGDSLWREKADAFESKDLRGQPEVELDIQLTRALTRMADAPVASNFTARVMATMDREDSRVVRAAWHWKWNWFLPRVAMGMAVIFFAGLGLRYHELNSHRTILAKNVAMVATANPLPSVDALENLDAIQRMSQSAHADGELLADFQ